MKKRILIYFLLWFSVGLISNAQPTVDFDNYQLLKSSGSLPNDVTVTSTEKYKKSLGKIDEMKISKREKNIQKAFQLYANFTVDEALLSGLVLYNDPLGIYINKVAKTLLQGHLEIYNEMKFYVIQSPWVNALTTPNGIVLVTLGLLSHLENEAQLALVLSHEIQHYIKGHNYKGFKYKATLDKNTDKKSDLKEIDNFIKRTAYSRELESEADEEGLKLYAESGYSLNAIKGLFDILQFSNLPFVKTTFNSKILESEKLIFPPSFIPTDSMLTPIDINSDEYDDELSTHPNIKKRREALLKLAAKTKPKGDALFVIGEQDFKDVRKISQYEYVHLCMVYQQYEDAFVSLNILLNENPKSHYLRRNLNHCLYVMAKKQLYYGQEHYYHFMHTSHKIVEGPAGGAYYFLGKMIKSEIGLTTLALETIWNYHLANPEDNISIRMVEELSALLTLKYNIDAESMKNLVAAKPMSLFKERKQKKFSEMTYDKPKEFEIDKSKSKANSMLKSMKPSDAEFNSDSIKSISNALFYTVLANLAQNQEFAKMMTNPKKKNRTNVEKTDDLDDQNSTEKSGAIEDIYTFDFYEFDKNIDIEKMVLISPFYVKKNYNKKEKFRYVYSENKVVKLSETIKNIADKVGIDIEDINTKTLKEGDVEKLNDMSLINNYMTEKVNDSDFTIISIDQSRIEDFIKKHHTPYIFKLGVISIKEEKLLREFCDGCFGVLMIFFRDYHYTFYGANVIDLKTGKDVYVRYKMYNHSDRELLLDINLYDLLFQIKTKK